MYTFRVIPATQQLHDDAGFASTRKVYCVVNQSNHVYALWAGSEAEIQALNYRDKLTPTMRPPAFGGSVENGRYSK